MHRPSRRRPAPARAPRVATLVLALTAGLATWAALHPSEPPSPETGDGVTVSTPEGTSPTPHRALAAASATSIPAAGPEPLLTPSPVGRAPTLAVPDMAIVPQPTPSELVRASRFAPVPFQPDPILGARVAQRIAGLSGRFGVAIKDLQSGRGVLIDPDGEYEAASLFKLPVMYEVFKQRGPRLSFSEALVLTDRHVAYDLGTLDRPAGSTMEIREALERMITISDNSSAILLTDRVGALNINQGMQALGLAHTRVRLDDLRTSPADMLAFFELLARGQGVSAEASAEMVQLLARQRVNDRIPRRLPNGVVVAHKTGNLPGVVNDAGIVYGPDVAFVIAVLVEGTRNEGEAALAIGDLAAMAYDYFRGTGAAELQFPTSAPTATLAPSATLPPAPTATSASPSATPEPSRTPGAAPGATPPSVPSSRAPDGTAPLPATTGGSPTPQGNGPTPGIPPVPTPRPSPHPSS